MQISFCPKLVKKIAMSKFKVKEVKSRGLLGGGCKIV
jgi:hypothetical protein